MGKENSNNKGLVADEFEKLLARKGPKLAPSTSKYISRLKQEGRLEEASGKAFEARVRKVLRTPEERLEREIVETVYRILHTEDIKELTESEARFVWLLTRTGEVQNIEERKSFINEIFDSKPPRIQEFLGENLPRIRDEVGKI